MSSRPAARAISPWRRRAFALVMAACVQFPVLTLLAMLVYPGGTLTDPAAPRYSFFHNFFSDLGRTRTVAGEPNTLSMVLFMVALTVAGGGLILYSVAALRFFAASRAARAFSWLGCGAGIVAGLGFVGVAFAPYDRGLAIHGWFVLLAFQAFLPAALGFMAAILLTPGYPRRYAWLYLAFALLLAAYVLLLRIGPSLQSDQGVMIQAAGQKGIVYAGILCVLLQAWGARRLSGQA